MRFPIPVAGGDQTKEVSVRGTGKGSRNQHEEGEHGSDNKTQSTPSPPVIVDPENRHKARHDPTDDEQVRHAPKKA